MSFAVNLNFKSLQYVRQDYVKLFEIYNGIVFTGEMYLIVLF